MAGKKVLAIKAGAPGLDAEGSYGPDDMTCAICLEQIQLENTAYVKGCEHAYCGMVPVMSFEHFCQQLGTALACKQSAHCCPLQAKHLASPQNTLVCA